MSTMTTEYDVPALPQGMPPIVIAERDTWEESIQRMRNWMLTITTTDGREHDVLVTDTGSDAGGFVTIIGRVSLGIGRSKEVTISTEEIASVYVN